MFQIRLCRSYRFDSCVLSASKIARQARPAGRFPCRHRMMLPMTMANMCRRNSVVLCESSAKRISASFSCAFCSLYVCLPSRRQSVMLSAWHMTIVRCRRAALIWMSVQFTCVRAMKGLEVQGLSGQLWNSILSACNSLGDPALSLFQATSDKLSDASFSSGIVRFVWASPRKFSVERDALSGASLCLARQGCRTSLIKKHSKTVPLKMLLIMFNNHCLSGKWVTWPEIFR